MALEGSTVFIILVLVSGLVPYSQISFASAQLADKDADGVPDDLDNCPNDPNPLQEDIDSDGIGDACQTGDQDGDGIPNNVDNCPKVANPLQEDTDGDGIGDACQIVDDDGDGVDDAIDNCPNDPNSNQQDTDGDGIGDACQPGDSDGDGIQNKFDNCDNKSNPLQEDTDSDTVGDVCEDLNNDGDLNNDDTDGNGLPNYRDNDDDNDGFLTTFEDSDGDGSFDNDDADSDGIPNWLDATFNPPPSDSDGDGRDDLTDNCPINTNPLQEDVDGDGIGDACDSFPFDPQNDAEGDGVGANEDNCPLDVNPDQSDSDLDGIGDACEERPGVSINDVSISNISLGEGDLGTTDFVFDVVLTNPAPFPLTVQFSTANSNGAVVGQDYLANSGTLSFDTGDLTKQIIVQVTGDGLVEPDESFSVFLFNPIGTDIIDAKGVGLILNDDNAPVADNQSVPVDEDTPIPITLTAVDGDLDPLTFMVVTAPTHGDLSGTVPNLTYTPNSNFNGDDFFTFKVSDGINESNEATINITVAPVNDAPVAADDTTMTSEDTPLDVAAPGVLSNDFDVENDILTSVLASGPTNAAFFALNADGSFTYTPNLNFVGVDSFTYMASDGVNDSNVSTVLITVGGTNDAPVALDDSATTPEDNAVVISVLDNDSDVDGDTLSILSSTQPDNGQVTINADGTIGYTPNPNFFGTDIFTYTISDGSGNGNGIGNGDGNGIGNNNGNANGIGATATATVSVTVTAVNDPPITLDVDATITEDTPTDINVLGNDPADVDGDSLSISLITDPPNGSAIDNGDGTINYAPDQDFFGTDIFDYTVSDGMGGTDTATATVTVTPVNDAPVALDDSATTPEDNAVVISVLDNDSDVDGDIILFDSVADPANGSVESDGISVTYTPNPNFFGTDAFVYAISDGNGGATIATVSITVTPVNDAPVAADDTTMTSEDSPLITDTPGVLSNDFDVENDILTSVLASGPTNAAFFALNADGSFTYTPNLNFVGVDSFTYMASDGVNDSNVSTVLITVGGTNDAPVALDDSATTPEDNAVVISVLDNDSDPDGDTILIDSTAQPANGSVESDGISATYTPNPNFFGTDTFTYTITDNNGGTATATVTVVVESMPDNLPPIAADDSASTQVNTAITISVLSNDLDPDGNLIVIDSVSEPQHGTAVIADNSVTYTPDTLFSGTDTFTYTITDNNGGTATATVTVDVQAGAGELFCGLEKENYDNVIFGKPGDVNDNLVGTQGNDLIVGLGGSDTIRGKGGNDCLIGGDGNDKIWGGKGDDKIEGNNGNDKLYGNDGTDSLTGGENDDKMWGGQGNDSLDGSAGNDRLQGQQGHDTLTGDLGDDWLSGGQGDDIVNAGDGNDKLLGKAGNDKLYGQNGNDMVHGGQGNDTLDGGSDDDVCYDSHGTNKFVACERQKPMSDDNDENEERD